MRLIILKLIFLLSILLTASTGYAERLEGPEILGETGILMDAKTGEILYEKGIHEKMYPASITKIITGIIAIEHGNLDDIVEVSENARNVIGTRVYLLEGEKVPMYKLLRGILVSSGNDAAIAIAEHFDGSEEKFAERMNQFVRETVGVENTSFANPHGLFDENQYTTAYDMAKITKYAMQNDIFREVVGTREYEWIGEGWETTIYNHNQLLHRYEGATGVKNGFVRMSGFTLVTTAKRDGSEFIAVTLNVPFRNHAYKDVERLFDFAFENFETAFLEGNQVFKAKDAQKFILDEPIAYTIEKGEEVTMEVNELGLLLVKGNRDRIVTRVLLDSLEENVQLIDINVRPLKVSNLHLDSNDLYMIGPLSQLFSTLFK